MGGYSECYAGSSSSLFLGSCVSFVVLRSGLRELFPLAMGSISGTRLFGVCSPNPPNPVDPLGPPEFGVVGTVDQ